MTLPQSQVLEFPAMLHGLTGAVFRQVRAKGEGWARDYLNTGAFTQPRQMLQVTPGELLEVQSGVLFDANPHRRWRVLLFSDVFMSLSESLPADQRSRAREAFESFCLSTPWGALFNAVSPYPPRSAERMAKRLAALLRFWDLLQVPRYVYRYNRQDTLEELVDDIYGMTLGAWCPGSTVPVRERLALAVDRMSHATRAECMEAVLRAIPVLVGVDKELKQRKELSDPGFLLESLAALSPEDFDDVSGTEKFALSMQLADWHRQLARR